MFIDWLLVWLEHAMKKAVITVRVPHDTSIDNVLEAVVSFGRALKVGVQADIRWMPINPERHSNQGIIKIPHRRRQFANSMLPEPPDVA